MSCTSGPVCNKKNSRWESTRIRYVCLDLVPVWYEALDGCKSRVEEDIGMERPQRGRLSTRSYTSR